MNNTGVFNYNGESIYFMEDFSPLVRNIKGKIIALTPKVCYQLDKEKISYQTYEDFYDMFERKKYAEGYQSRLSSWIDSFDDYLRDKLKDSLDKKINFVRLYGYYITTMLDSFIPSSQDVVAVFNKLKPLPSKVYLITQPHSHTEFDWRLFINKGDLSYYLLPIICRQLNLPYSIIAVDSENIKHDHIFNKLKHFLRRGFKSFVRIAEGLYNQLVYLFFSFKRKKLKKEKELKTFLILSEEWLDNFYRDFIKAGHKILYHTASGPKRYLFLRKRDENEINNFYFDDNTALLWKKIGEDCIREFNPSGWPNSEAGIDLCPILNERFLYFLQKICPIISVTAKKYQAIFEKSKIDYVLGVYKIIPSDFGAMAAATLSLTAYSVFVQHGSCEMEAFLQHFSELPTNIHVTPSREEALFYSRYFNSGNKNKVKVIAARSWIDKYKYEADKISYKFFKLNLSKRLNRCPIKVYYLPGAFSLQRLGATYPFCWYYFFQRALCEHFARLDGYRLIIKVLSTTTWFSEPILEFLKDLNAPNISYADGDLIANLRQADRVITDYPSTPTFEARLMGLPVLSLYYDSIGIRNTAQEVYGKTLVSFKTKQEAMDHIDRFLVSDPKDYIISMEENFSASTLLDILEQYKK